MPSDEQSGAEPSPDNDAAPTGFAALGLRSELLDALTTLGYEEPTPIQRQDDSPLLLEGVRSSSAKRRRAPARPPHSRCRSFSRHRPRQPRPFPTVLVAHPDTRARRPGQRSHVQAYGAQPRASKVVPIYGGQPIQRQLQALRRGVHVVVATPGRAIDHIRRGSLDLDGIRTVVLDEADEMLDMGFTEDIELDPRADAGRTADGHVLGHDAPSNQRHRRAPSAGSCPRQDQRRRLCGQP